VELWRSCVKTVVLVRQARIASAVANGLPMILLWRSCVKTVVLVRQAIIALAVANGWDKKAFRS
jgi:hypothetical protein